MPKIINVPIEPLEERYSEQWNRWIPEDLKSLGIDFVHLNWVTPLSNTIRDGSFLDVIGTNFYKASQLQQLMVMFEQKEINGGDVILLNDIWFPGIEMLAYVRDALGIDFKIAGIAHAGTWDPQDFLAQMDMETWAKDLENSWFESVDYVLVNSLFHKELLLETRKVKREKIFVTGYPFKPEEFVIPNHPKENIVVFPHRLNQEKQPELFDRIARDLKEEFPDWQFIKTKDVWTDKKAYYELLNRSKIAFSCALQETFGIAMVEATMCGCIPIVPDRLSYKYLYDGTFRYTDFSQPRDFGKSKIRWAIILANILTNNPILEFQKNYFIAESNRFASRVVNITLNNKRDEWRTYLYAEK
jgi:hypothetical protein